jgi:DNA-binding transcriptional MerR regulator
MEQASYTIDELCRVTGYSRRTIRYYVSEGLLEPPAGRGRGGFYYDSHLKRLQQIRALQDKGLRISEIQKMSPEVQATVRPVAPRETWLRLPVCPGLEIHVRDDLEAARRKEIEALLRIGKTLFQQNGEEHEDN